MHVSLRNRIIRISAFTVLTVVMVFSLYSFDTRKSVVSKQERLYFPSGHFLKEASLGFREVNADYLWFRFIQYYGAYAKGTNNFRHFELLINGITTLDPNFVEAYHFASLVTWSDLGKPLESIDILKRGIHHNPDTARLYFQVGMLHYAAFHDPSRASFWFNKAAECSDSTDLDRRFAAYSTYRSGDNLGSLDLWFELYNNTTQPGMKKLAEKMINIIHEKMEKSELEVSLNNPSTQPGA